MRFPNSQTEIKACPFCGETELRFYHQWGFLGMKHWIECSQCKARTRKSSDKRLAIKWWNMRFPESLEL